MFWISMLKISFEIDDRKLILLSEVVYFGFIIEVEF